MWRMMQQFRRAHLQTQFFVLNLAIYLIALLWTTAQAYLRLEYNGSGPVTPIFVETPPSTPPPK